MFCKWMLELCVIIKYDKSRKCVYTNAYILFKIWYKVCVPDSVKSVSQVKYKQVDADWQTWGVYASYNQKSYFNYLISLRVFHTAGTVVYTQYQNTFNICELNYYSFA